MKKINVSGWFTITILAGIFLFSCSMPTKIVKSWVADDLDTLSASERKTIIFAFVKSDPDRTKMEDLFNNASQNISQSYKIITREDIELHRSMIQNYLLVEGFQRAITMRLVRKQEKSEWVQSNYINSYDSYHNNQMMDYYNPGYYITGSEYYIETNIFSISDGKLLWSVTTKTPETLSREDFLDELAGVLIKQMRKDGLVD